MYFEYPTKEDMLHMRLVNSLKGSELSIYERSHLVEAVVQRSLKRGGLVDAHMELSESLGYDRKVVKDALGKISVRLLELEEGSK